MPRAALPVLSSSFSSLIFAVLPKCPACLVVLLAPLGIKVPGSRWFLAYACVFAAGIPATSKQPEAAKALIQWLASPAAHGAIKKTGLEPAKSK